MSIVHNPIGRAERVLKQELRQRHLAAVVVSREGSSWLKIHLRDEGRSLWLGHVEERGYFMTWDRSSPGNLYFDLDSEGIQGLVALLPAAANEGPQPADRMGRALVDEMQAEIPDVEAVSDIIEEAHASDAGLDVLSTLATVKRFRWAIEKLRHLLETQGKEKHPERAYQDLLAEHPWMLGSHYSKVLREECPIWLGSRVDLLLKNALGHIDIVEVKRPDANLIVRGSRKRTWRAGESLSDVLAQARKYLRLIDEQRLVICKELGLPEASESRMYRSSVIIVAGRRPSEAGAQEALKEINTEYGRLLILTYDDVVAVAESTISLFEHRLSKFPQLLPSNQDS